MRRGRGSSCDEWIGDRMAVKTKRDSLRPLGPESLTGEKPMISWPH